MICCICENEFNENKTDEVLLGSIRFKSKGGHNPDPVKDQGKCCSRCNYEVVIPARLDMMYEKGLLTRKSKKK